MKLNKFVKLFTFVGLLVLSCSIISKVSALNFKGIDFNLSNSSTVLEINKDVDDENVRIELAKYLRDRCPKICVVKTPLCRYTMTITTPGSYDSEFVDYVTVVWELLKTPATEKEKAKLTSFMAYVIFDTVDSEPGKSSVCREEGKILDFTRSKGLHVRPKIIRETVKGYSRDAKRLICKLYVDPKICPFFRRPTQIVSDHLFSKICGPFSGYVAESFFSLPVSV